MWKPLKLLPWFITAGVAWGTGFAFNAYNGGLISWLRGMYEDKMVMAAELQASRRLLIVGGSGAHYTVNSRFMAQELGVPVLNLGLDGNLGFNVIFPLILEQIRPGDIVFLAPEYLLLLDEDGIGERSVQFGIAIGQPGLGTIPAKQFAQDAFLFGVPSLRNLTKVSVDLIQKGYIDEYYADPITDRGDPTKTWERKSEWWQMRVSRPVTRHSVQMIAQFREDVEAKGGTLVLSLPIIYGSRDEKTMENVAETAKRLGEVAPILYDETTLNIWTDSDLFADTHYHLKEQPRITRSQEIIRQLRDLLGDDLDSPIAPTTAQ